MLMAGAPRLAPPLLTVHIIVVFQFARVGAYIFTKQNASHISL